VPKFFEQYVDPDTGENGFKMSRDYWADRKAKKFDDLENLF